MSRITGALASRGLVRALLFYAAGAWIAVEIVAFLTTTYAWPRRVVDLAVLLAASGGVATLILTWFHGEEGRQRFSRLELAMLLVLAIATAGIAARITLANPYAEFLQPAVHTLVVEFPLTDAEAMDFTWSPASSTRWTAEGTLLVEPEEMDFELGGLELHAEGLSTWLRFDEAGDPRLYVALATLPPALRSSPAGTSAEEPWIVRTIALSLALRRDAKITSFADSTVVRVAELPPA